MVIIPFIFLWHFPFIPHRVAILSITFACSCLVLGTELQIALFYSLFVLCMCYLQPQLACKFLDKYCSFCFVSFSFPVELSLLRFLSAELTRGYFLEHNEAKYTERRERVYTCMRIPRELEKVLFFFLLPDIILKVTLTC